MTQPDPQGARAGCVCHVLGREGCRQHSYAALEDQIVRLRELLDRQSLTDQPNDSLRIGKGIRHPDREEHFT